MVNDGLWRLFKDNSVSEAEIITLQKQKINSISQLTKTPLKALKEYLQCSQQRAEDIQEAAIATKKQIFQTGSKIDNQNQIHPTETLPFDELLQGGLESGAITEISGAYATGKSQITMTLTANFMHRGPVYFIDTENTFRYGRIKQINQEQQASELEEENLKLARINNTLELQQTLEYIRDHVQDIELLVIDSFTNPFRLDYLSDRIIDRQQVMLQNLRILHEIGQKHAIPILITNQVQKDPDNKFGDHTQPAGGHILAHQSTHRIHLTKNQKYRKAKLIDSPNLPPGETTYKITAKGIQAISEVEE